MPSPPSIPDHVLLRPIGRGAYGEVWLARNIMGTPRAVKIIWRQQFESDRPYEREFAGIQGYEPVSRTSDGLMQVLHVGRNDAEGYFYYVMELADDERAGERVVRGENSKEALTPIYPFSPAQYSPHTLRSDLNRLGRLPISDCLRIALDLVTGLACLHQHGLVHRDVKPGNIIFVNGRAKLADIGLVSSRNEGRTFVGTEGYIPPEGPGSPAADLYALGMVLYEATTGQPPEKFPQTPIEWFAEGTGGERIEFHEIVLKAGEGARERRYQTAAEFQRDLALLQSGQSLRRVRALQRRANLSRRLAVAAVMALVVAVGSVLLSNYRVRVEAEQRARERIWREDAERERAAAEQAGREAHQQLVASLTEQARVTVRSGEMGHRVRALDAIRRAAAFSNVVELRREVFAALALPDLRFEHEVPCSAAFTLRALAPSFESIAVGRGTGAVEIRASVDHRLLATLPASTNLAAYNALWSNDGRFLAVKRDYDTEGLQADVEVWEASSARRVMVRRDVPTGAMSFHPHLHHRLAIGTNGGVSVLDLDSGRDVTTVPLVGKPWQIRYAPEGDRLAALYPFKDSWMLSIHDISKGQALTMHVFAEPVSVMAWHPDGSWLAVTEHGGMVRRMDARSGEVQLLGRHKAQAASVAFSPVGDYLLSGGWEGELICWDARTLQRAFTIGLDSYQAQWSADGSRCAVLTELGVRLHRFERPGGFRQFAEDLGPRLRRATFSHDGRWLAAAADNRMGVWDLTGDDAPFLDDAGYETHLFFTPDSRELFGCRSGRSDGFRWAVAAATNSGAPAHWERQRLYKPAGFTFLSPLSNSIVVTAAKGSQVIAPENFATGGGAWASTESGTSATSPDGRWLGIFRSFSRELHIYALPGFERVTKIVHPGGIGQVAFSPDGNGVTISSRLGVEFWNTKSWERTQVLTNFVRIYFAHSTNECWLVKDQRTAGLYDARTLEPLLPLPRGMLPLALSPDGRHLAVSVDARRLQVWDLEALRRELTGLGLGWSSF